MLNNHQMIFFLSMNFYELGTSVYEFYLRYLRESSHVIDFRFQIRFSLKEQ